MATPNPRRERLENELAEAYREVDKILVTVASGVVAISVALIGNVKHAVETWSIRSSWILMFATVLSVLISLRFEQADKRKRIAATYTGRDEVDGVLTKAIRYLNLTSILTFIGGLLGLGWFLWMNTH
jgi:hypothetical protein